MRKLVYLVACTADGFIGRADGSVDFFPMSGEHLPFLAREYPETISGHLRHSLGVSGENRHFGAVLMGRRTYEVGTALGIISPYPHLDQFVISSTMLESPDPSVRLVRSDPVGLVRRLKREPGLDIWLCGGGSLAGVLYEEIDELILKVNPVVLGTGTPLFSNASGPRRLELTNHQTFSGGVALHHYRVNK
jgi:dihydrofolate reductase